MRQRLVSVAGPVLSLLLLSPVMAAQAKKEPPKGTELKKKVSESAPESDLAGDITRRKTEKAAERPALDYDQYRLDVDLQVASKRREQIETLQKIIKLGPSAQEAPDLIFRLAELYWEESKYYFFESNRKDDDILRARADKNKAAEQRGEAEKRDSLKKSESYQALAVEQYWTIVKRHPKYQRMDEVLFFLGHNMWDGGKEGDAVVVYQKLIKDHQQSKYLADAWLAIGQHFFNTSNGRRELLEKSLEAYRKAASFTESKVYGYALYMQGWALYNLGEFKSALDMYKAVIYYGELQGAADTRSTALSKEARKDYVVAYSHIGDVLGAKSDFQKVGGEANWWMMLKGLAGLYFEDGKDKEATLVYSQLLRDRPVSPEAPFFQGRIVDCVMRVGIKKVTVNQVRELVRVIKEVERSGNVRTDEEKKAYQDARDLAERTMSNLAVNWHNEAKKTRDETTFGLAADVYQDYLEIFSKTPKAYDLRFFYAELLNDNLNKYDRSAEEYTQVVLQDIELMDPPKDAEGNAPAPQKPGRWLVDASYNAILAYDEVAKRFETTEQLPKSDGKSPMTIPAPKKNLLAACERYIKYVPKGDKLVEVTYKAAGIYYRYSYFDKAVEMFASIALEHPESELAEYSANLVLDSFNLQGDWVKVNEWARRFFAQPKLARGKFRDELAKVLEQSAFKLVNLAEEKGDFIGAAGAYLDFAREFPGSELADLALFNASVDFFKGKQVDRSIETRQQLVERYPGSRYLPQCIYANGESYETIGEFEKAADSYEAYAAGWADAEGKAGAPSAKAKGKGKGKKAAAAPAKSHGAFEQSKAQVALFNAGVFRQALGQYREALRDRLRYLELWPNAKDSEAMFLSIAELYEKSGQTGKALNHLEEYERQYGRDPDKMLAAEMRIARIYTRQKNTKNAQRIQGRALAYYEKLTRAQKARLGPEALEVVAKGAYQQNEKEFAYYSRLGIPQDEKRLKGALEAKQNALVEVQKAYTAVVALKAAEPAICSLYRIGQLYKNFADGLLTAPVPEMPFPKQLNQIKHLINVPWKKWPRDYKEAIPEADFENLQVQLADARQQFQQAYQDQLGQLAVPVEEKAADAFATTTEKSRELAIYNDCAAQALDLLSDKYKPMQFPRVTEVLAELKPAAPVREGVDILAAVQPIPVGPATPEGQGAPADPPPDFSGQSQAPAPKAQAAPAPSGGRKRPPAATPPAPPPVRNEPEDPDLL